MKRGNRNRVGDSNVRGGRHLADNARAELVRFENWALPDCRLQTAADGRRGDIDDRWIILTRCSLWNKVSGSSHITV